MPINSEPGHIWAVNYGDEGRPAGVGPVIIDNLEELIPSGSTYTGGNGIEVDNDNDIISLDAEAQAAIDSYVTNSGSFLTDVDLNGYATETWVQSQDYVDGTEMSEYVTSATSAFVTSGDIPEVPTIKDFIAGNGINITTTSADVTIAAKVDGSTIKIDGSGNLSTDITGVPTTSGASSGDVLTYNGSSVGWAPAQGGGSSYTAGDGIEITNNIVSVSLAENGGLDFKASSIDGAMADTWAIKFHVGTNPPTDAVASFTLKTDLTSTGLYPYFESTAYGGYAVLVLANHSDLSQYSICSSTLYGPMPYASLGGTYSDYIPRNHQGFTVSGTMSTLFGNSWTDYVDENGDIYLYLCDVSDNELNGSGYGPGGACAAFLYSTQYNSITLTSTLTGAATLSVANPVPAYDNTDEGKVLGVTSGSTDWVNLPDTSDMATQTWTAQNYFPIDGLQIVGSSAEASGANIIYIVSGSNA